MTRYSPAWRARPSAAPASAVATVPRRRRAATASAAATSSSTAIPPSWTIRALVQVQPPAFW
ncbi:MAG TPA: hypothetical protein VM734_07155 [Kofleriaceae bacterium]|nr:hypothetical protein [Kofleriaceae bacterium]